MSEPLGQFVGAGQPRLLVHREQELQRAVDEPLIFHDGEAGGDADSVVRPERRPFRLDPFTLDRSPDRIFGKIVNDIRVLFADHVHVPLKDHAFGFLVPRRRGHSHQDVSDLVPLGFEAQVFGGTKDIIT